MSSLLPDMTVTYESLILQHVSLSKDAMTALGRGEVPEDICLFDAFKYVCCTDVSNQMEVVCELVRRGVVINLGWKVGDKHVKSTYKLMSLLTTTTDEVSEFICFMHMDLLHARLIEWLEGQSEEVVKCVLMARTRRLFGRVGTMLHWAFMEEQFELVREIFECLNRLEDKAFVKEYINSCMSDGNSVIHVCLMLKRYRWVSYCLSHGCHIDKKNDVGLTPAHLAIRFDHVDTLKAFQLDVNVSLVEYAIECNASNCLDWMLIQKNSFMEHVYLMELAVEKHDLDCVLCLLKHGMDVFDIEITDCSPEIAWELLSRGMPPTSTEMIVSAVETVPDVNIPIMTLLLHDLHLTMKTGNDGFLQRHMRLYTTNMFLLLTCDEHAFSEKATRWKELISQKKI